MPPHRNAYRPVVMGRRGAVASAHPLATLAAIQMLLAGGNAMDAAIATATALTVVEPYMSGLGGLGVMLIFWAKDAAPHVLDFCGGAPGTADPARVTLADLGAGPRSCVVPGSLAGWLAAHERFGTMARAEVLAPTIRLAEEGVALTWKNCEFFDLARETLTRSADVQRIYLGSGGLRPGRILVQKELGATYRQVAEGGAEVFYRGSLGREICRAVQEAGGWLTPEDLAAFAPKWCEPLSIPLRGTRIYTPPPPFLSFQILETLNILDADDLAGWGHNSDGYLHHLIEAIKLASADQLAYANLPQVRIARLLSKAYAASQRRRIDPRRARVSEGERFDPSRLPGQILPGRPAHFLDEHTTHFACADQQGNVVTVTQTLGSFFGSGFAAPGTGVILNNALKWMDLEAESPHVVRPGRKGGLRMSPTQIFQDDRFFISIGTPGSYGIMQTTPQMILNLLAFDMNIQEAIEAPRVRVYRDRLVDAEGRIPIEVREGLARRGHQINPVEDWSWIVGGGQGILRDPESGVLMGGADPRRDGYTLAI